MARASIVTASRDRSQSGSGSESGSESGHPRRAALGLRCMPPSKVFALAGLFLAAAACNPQPVNPIAPAASGSANAAQRLAIEMGDRVLSERFASFPELTTTLRPAGATFDGLEDDSIAAVAAREAKLEAWDKELSAVDPATLHGSKLATLSYQVAYE